jgi:hypothetical protein
MQRLPIIAATVGAALFVGLTALLLSFSPLNNLRRDLDEANGE